MSRGKVAPVLTKTVADALAPTGDHYERTAWLAMRRELRALLAVAQLATHARDNIAQVARVLRGHGCSTGDDLNGEARTLENIVDGLDLRLRSLSRGRNP